MLGGGTVPVICSINTHRRCLCSALLPQVDEQHSAGETETRQLLLCQEYTNHASGEWGVCGCVCVSMSVCLCVCVRVRMCAFVMCAPTAKP